MLSPIVEIGSDELVATAHSRLCRYQLENLASIPLQRHAPILMLYASSVRCNRRGYVPVGLDRAPFLGLVHGLDGRNQTLAEALCEEIIQRVVHPLARARSIAWLMLLPDAFW